MNKKLYHFIILSGMAVIAFNTQADIELYKTDDTLVAANIAATAGTFYSKKNYIPDAKNKSYSWQEGYIQYGLNAEHKIGEYGLIYAKTNLVSAATWGDGDAAGFSDGSERATKVEDAFIGWKSGDLIPWLGNNGLNISLGRQNICFGDGFLICADAPNIGNSPLLGKAFNGKGGGTYYLAGHRNFNDTVMIKLGNPEGLHGSLSTFKSNNAIQAYSKFYAATLDYTDPKIGTLGFTYLHNDSVDSFFAKQVSPILTDREGMDVYSLRGEGSLGVENMTLGFEYAVQDKANAETENAWYVKSGYLFDIPWKPSFTLRYSRFSEKWDNLFVGALDYGKWFQGEVAYNYSGPFNANTQISNIGFNINPHEKLTLGLQAYDFDTLNKHNNPDLSGQELDLYALWSVKQNIIVSPLFGIYKPKRDLLNNGSQNGDDKVNLYAQMVLNLSF
ncbi:hypothetical protein ACINWC323_1977 [Acinetobacter sp. WC-323]|uniref:hypothetical protein n=1 Tax=Acinetobacter sp. WC-323 TaxID=903918 RepID=UPI00029E3E98|nr:hypothetical protein [Acinetobacter sp. WC-323]EKU51444.1 hypothetical protein ACINWC323_1977 [Acinetobacter sp. WC-323]